MIPNVMTPHVMILHMMDHVVMAPMMTTVPQDMLVTGEYDASEVPGQEVGGGQGRNVKHTNYLASNSQFVPV